MHNQTVFPDRSFEVFVDVDGKQGKIVVQNKLLSLQVHYHFYYNGEEQVSRMFDSSCRNSLESVLSVSVPDFEVQVCCRCPRHASLLNSAMLRISSLIPWVTCWTIFA